MNILPHKSWHVRTKQNIARVRRDEEKAKREEHEKLKRINLAEHEARITLLKSKNGITSQNSNKTDEEFNLFDNFKDKILNDNEKESEKKVDQEKWEVKAGIFSYLDGRYKYQNDKDEQWYLKSRKERFSSTSKEGSESLKDSRTKQIHDPLTDVRKYLSVMEKRSTMESKIKSTSRDTTLKKDIPKQQYIVPKKKKRSKDKSHKSKKKRNLSPSDSEDSSNDEKSISSKEIMIHKLRQERLERERKERLRSKQLLEGPNTNVPETDLISNRSFQKYNSQFNPHIARQNCPNL